MEKKLIPAALAEVEEISGHGIHAQVQINGEWKEIYIGNQKLMGPAGCYRKHACGSHRELPCIWQREPTYLGSIVISDSVRPDVPAMLAGLKKQGVSRLVMLTGDKEEVGKKRSGVYRHYSTCSAICSRVTR
ncbi:MAG: HAD family hydrolase [Clostridium sp.]